MCRYGLKVGQLVRGKDYAGLGGVYDQGWGMADPQHGKYHQYLPHSRQISV